MSVLSEPLSIGENAFGEAVYDPRNDLLYLTVRRDAAGPVDSADTPEGHVYLFGEDGSVSGLDLNGPTLDLERDGQVRVTTPGGVRVSLGAADLREALATRLGAKAAT